MIKRLSYLLVLLFLAFAISLPIVFQYIGSWSAPTSVYALNIIKDGHFPSAHVVYGSKTYWGEGVEYEADYPLPATLVSEFAIVTGVPLEYLNFLPIAGLATIMYFVLARMILLCDNSSKASNISLLFSALFYAYVLFGSGLAANGMGRATLGVVLFPFFLFCCFKYFYNYSRGLATAPWSVVTLIFTLAIGFTHYTETLTIAIIATVVGIFLPLPALLKRRRFAGLTFGLTATILFVFNTYLGKMPINGLTNIIPNAITYVKSTLGLEQNLTTQLYIGYKSMDLLTHVLTRVFSAFQILTIICAIAVMLMYFPKISVSRKKRLENTDVKPNYNLSLKPIWLFSIIILSCTISGLGYLSVSALTPFNTVVRYTPLFFFFLIGTMIQHSYEGDIVKRKNIRKKVYYPMIGLVAFSKNDKLVRIAAVVLVLIALLGLLGAFRQNWIYGSGGAKPFGYDDLQGAADFIITHSNGAPVVIGGDAYYMSLIFFRASLNDVNNVSCEPLTRDAITLYNSTITGNTDTFFKNMKARNIAYLLTVDPAEPLWGDAFGYAVKLSNFDAISSQSNLVYNGYLQIYQFR